MNGYCGRCAVHFDTLDGWCEHQHQAPDPQFQPHGTSGRYQQAGCRCRVCRIANWEYQKVATKRYRDNKKMQAAS